MADMDANECTLLAVKGFKNHISMYFDPAASQHERLRVALPTEQSLNASMLNKSNKSSILFGPEIIVQSSSEHTRQQRKNDSSVINSAPRSYPSQILRKGKRSKLGSVPTCTNGASTISVSRSDKDFPSLASMARVKSSKTSGLSGSRLYAESYSCKNMFMDGNGRNQSHTIVSTCSTVDECEQNM